MTVALAMVLAVLLAPLALWVALPALADFWMWLAGQRQGPGDAAQATARLCFVVPAHDEELLIRRTVGSLRAMAYPADHMAVVVVADNCTDGTARAARDAGARVLERTTSTLRGKGHALAWTWDQVRHEPFDALIIIDADTIVDAHLARDIGAVPRLRGSAVQVYDDMSNEGETAITRMAGILTRSRYGIAYALKARAGLAVPLTGDGSVIGWEVLERHGLETETITEGWELYVRYTLAGVPSRYLGGCRVYAQEARSLDQSGTQRARWTAGRLSVLRAWAGRILAAPGLSLLQRLDLVAELSNVGPVVRAAMAMAGMAAAQLAPSPLRLPLTVLFSLGIVQPAWYALVSLVRHEAPGAALRAFAYLPVYAAWRVGVGLRAFGMSGRKHWVRTARHEEGGP